MKFGLILCTLGRDKEVESLLKSLLNQSYKNFYLIVVDQNKDNKIDSILKKYKNKIIIKHLKVNFKGLSKARNYGLKYIEKDTDVVAFPDDDCEYPKNLLLKIAKFLKKNTNYSFITGISIDRNGYMTNGKFKTNPTEINKLNLLETAISYTIFIRSYCLNDIRFDENLGVGSKFGSTEESDFIYQLLEKKCKGFYFPGLVKVIHPEKGNLCNDKFVNRSSYYALGLGAFFKKNFIKHKDFGLFLPFLNHMIIRPFGGFLYSIIRFNKCKIKLYLSILKNRWIGFLYYGR